jgi:hypothetical protein
MLPSYYINQQQKKISYGRISLHVLIFSIILFLGFVFLCQTNNLVAQNHSLRKNQAALRTFQDENQRLRSEIMRLESLAALQGAIKDFGMVAVDHVGYIDVSQPLAKLP